MNINLGFLRMLLVHFLESWLWSCIKTVNSSHFCWYLGFRVQESKSSTKLLHIILGSSVLLFLE